jgi:hypothetical protein
MRHTVYISTRGRPGNIRKVTPVWRSMGFNIVLTVEPQEVDLYAASVDWVHYPRETKIQPLPKANQGLAYSRHHALIHAASYGLESIIVADDDIKPAWGMATLVEDASHSKVLGITARYSYHDLALGGRIKKFDGVILQPCGMFRMVALNVDNVMKLGNYDPAADNCEDADLMLNGIQHGFPWMVDLDSKALSMGKRHEPGGSLDYLNYIGRSVQDHTRWKPSLENKYPEVVGNFKGTTRVFWRKAYDMYMPGWKKYSALHGGDIFNYLDGE